MTACSRGYDSPTGAFRKTPAVPFFFFFLVSPVSSVRFFLRYRKGRVAPFSVFGTSAYRARCILIDGLFFLACATNPTLPLRRPSESASEQNQTNETALRNRLCRFRTAPRLGSFWATTTNARTPRAICAAPLGRCLRERRTSSVSRAEQSLRRTMRTMRTTTTTTMMTMMMMICRGA